MVLFGGYGSYQYLCIIKEAKANHSLLNLKIMNFNSIEFKIAQELTISEFCTVCQNKGMTVEETKAEMIANAAVIAERIKAILA